MGWARAVVPVAIVLLTCLAVRMSILLGSNSTWPIYSDDAGALPTDSTSTGGYLTIGELTRNPPAGSIICPEGLFPVYDRIVDEGSAANAAVPPRKIPRTIHASFKTRCVAPDTYLALRAWKDALPRHSFYFHDDEAVDRLFKMPWEMFPQLRLFMKCVRFTGAMRIDVWRLLVIYRYGGLYTDVDNVPSEKFTEAGPIGAHDDAFFLSDSWNRPSQWFFAMTPRHPIAYFALFSVFVNLQKLESIERPSVVFVTGPDALKRGYGDALGWKTSVGDGKDIFAEGTHRCKWGSNVTKLLGKHGHITQLNMNEMVDFNGTKVPRKKRMEHLHKMKHWVDQKNTKKIEFDGSCMDYLYVQEHGQNVTAAG
ncbi:hypothetical protein ACHAXT_006621 [Thalassiosira profunda]